jgi:hypothetical protein
VRTKSRLSFDILSTPENSGSRHATALDFDA